MLTGLIVALVALGFPALAWAGQTHQGSGGGNLESMRLSEVGQTLYDWRRVLLLAGSAVVLVLLWGGDAIRPGSLQRSGLRNVKPLPPPVWWMGGLIVLLAPALTSAPLRDIGWITGGAGSSLRSVAAPQAVAYLAGIATAVGLLIMAGKAAPQAGLKIDWIDVPLGMGLLLLVSPVVVLTGNLAELVNQSLTSEAPANTIAHPLLSKIVEGSGDPWAWVLIAVAVVGAPIVEEVVYRVFIQSGLLRLTNHPWVSLILTSVIFGTMHVMGPEGTRIPWYAAVEVGVLGLCCGAAFERTKRVGVPIAMHATFNAANIAVAMWAAS
ncbi:MAG: CPBP family intramembrane metalloprotease [Phycisphaerales bacterium]|nr:CPBP family intramembrane metalloprotease [Phycisphaerales bacterium]